MILNATITASDDAPDLLGQANGTTSGIASSPVFVAESHADGGVDRLIRTREEQAISAAVPATARKSGSPLASV